jgi:hypothetical protein
MMEVPCRDGFAQKAKIPQTAVWDRSSASYTIKRALLCKEANPLHGSVGIVQVHSIYGHNFEGPVTNK